MGATVKDLGVPDGISRSEMAQIYRSVLAQCISLTRNKHRAEDIAHDTMLKVILIARKTNNVGPLLPYLLAAAKTMVIDEHRARARLARIVICMDVPELTALRDTDGLAPPDDFIRVERERRLLRELTDDDRRALRTLAAQQGHIRPRISRKQAARQLGLNTENEFDARIERLKRTITRVANENGIDFEIPLQEATRPSASEET